MTDRGRPPIYDINYCDKLINSMENGDLNCEIFAEWGISHSTFYQWKQDHSEFNEAYEIGLPKREAWWTRWGKKAFQGKMKGFDFKPWIAFMNKNFEYNTDNNKTNNTQININNIQVIQTKEDYQNLLEKVREQAQELNVIDVIALPDKEINNDN